MRREGISVLVVDDNRRVYGFAEQKTYRVAKILV